MNIVCPCGGKIKKNLCLNCGAVLENNSFVYQKSLEDFERGQSMPVKKGKRKFNKKDYVYCPNCENLIKRSNIEKDSGVFGGGEDCCPACGTEVEELEGKDDGGN